MKTLFKPKTTIETLSKSYISGKLNMIVKQTYADYTFTEIPNGMILVSPVKRDGYVFYVTSDEVNNYSHTQQIKIYVRMVTVCHENKSVLRCLIDVVETNEEEIYNNTKFYAYMPKTRNTKFEMKNDFNNSLGYTFYINDIPVGICSEYGDYAEYNHNAEGFTQFFFDDCDILIKSKRNNAIYNYADDFQKYEQLMRGSFPNYNGTLDSLHQMEIIGVSNTQRVDFATKKQNPKNKEDEFFIIRHASPKKIQEDGNPFEVYQVDPSRFHYSQGRFFRHHKYNTVFDREHPLKKNILSVVRGFTIDGNSLEIASNAISFVTCIIVNGEVLEVQECTR